MVRNPACRRALRILAFAHLGTSVACTLTSDFGIHQCESHADCDTLEGPVRRCEHSECVAGCADNRQCADIDPRYPICQRWAGQCVAPTSDDEQCFASSGYSDSEMGSLRGDEMLLLGAAAPGLRTSEWLTMELAAKEINASGGVPGAQGDRPLLLVACHDTLDAQLSASAHLLGDLAVKGVVATLEDEPLRAALALLNGSGAALFLSPNGSSSRPSELAGSGPLLWYLGAEYRDVVSAYPALVQRLADALLANVGRAQPIRIVSLVSEAAEDLALATRVEAVIQLDGRNTFELGREDRFQRFTVADASASRRQEVVQRLVASAPDLILLFVGGRFSDPEHAARTTLVRDIEAQVQAVAAAPPYYIAGPRNTDDAELHALATESSGFRERALGVRADRRPEPALTEAVRLRFNQAYPRLAVDGRYQVASNVYDAVYYLAYATAASSREAAPAQSPGQGFSRVSEPSAEQVDVGPGASGLDRARELIAAGLPFNLRGTSGTANFDPERHVRQDMARSYCWSSSGENDACDSQLFDANP